MEEVLEAREFVVRDSAGNVRGIFGMAGNDHVGLQFPGPGGLRALLSVHDAMTSLTLTGPTGVLEACVIVDDSGASLTLEDRVKGKVTYLSEDEGHLQRSKDTREMYVQLLAKIDALAELLVAKGVVTDTELTRYTLKVSQEYDQVSALAEDAALAAAAKEMVRRCERLKAAGKIAEYERLSKVLADYLRNEGRKRSELSDDGGDSLDEP